MWLADRGCSDTVIRAWEIQQEGTPMFKGRGRGLALLWKLEVTCDFVDLGFTGPEFTWHSRRYGHLIWERLDRGVANYDWLAKFPAALVRHLHCFSSDHHPIKLVFDPSSESQRWFQRPFHFEEMWLADRGCRL
ncbi:hypothetical protein CFP56_004662 [Quercus suber]|uniref:Endonuclease/exonuclease/phosphatase n=1 Tax=Quercus suber TaxID=58331 RepID=A0AAW0LBS3_QUESU